MAKKSVKKVKKIRTVKKEEMPQGDKWQAIVIKAILIVVLSAVLALSYTVVRKAAAKAQKQASEAAENPVPAAAAGNPAGL